MPLIFRARSTIRFRFRARHARLAHRFEVERLDSSHLGDEMTSRARTERRRRRQNAPRASDGGVSRV